MKEPLVVLPTTPFEDLVLGSQFTPVLAHANKSKEEESKQTNIGIFQCRKCGATFLEEQDALIHYKYHVFESHKAYFSVVIGSLCPQSDCTFHSSAVHFHCTYCSYSAREILQLPLHMEEGHLAFYKEVSLILKGEDVQMNKVYKCGECDKDLKGTVSIVHHLLKHEEKEKPSPEAMELIGSLNGLTNEKIQNSTSINIDDTENTAINSPPKINVNISDAIEDSTKNDLHRMNNSDKDFSDNIPVSLNGLNASTKDYCDAIINGLNLTPANNVNGSSTIGLLNGIPFLSPEFLKALKETQEKIEVEINPLDLLSTLMDEDQKSAFPMFPTQHFLLRNDNKKSSNGYTNNTGFSHSDEEEPEKNVNEQNSSIPMDEDSSGGIKSPGIGSNSHFLTPNNLSQPSLSNNSNGSYSEGVGNMYYDTNPPTMPSAGVFQCAQCNEGFKYQYLLIAHKKQVHQGNILTPFKCHICKNEFALLLDLKRHMVGHSKDFTHFCQVCGHAFLDPNALKNHMIEHGKSPGKMAFGRDNNRPISPVEKNTRCECCNHEFNSKSELTKHIVQYQGTCDPSKAEKNLRCATCNEEMISLEALKEHRKTSHPMPDQEVARLSKKGFQCDYCGKTFSCRSNLRDHLVVHTGEKPYPCEICGKTFSFIHNMKTHRLTHSQGRNEMCPYCDKAYKSKISLYYHMKKGNCRGLSTKEVPEGFQRCTDCLQMFASEERYSQHKTKGHCHMSYRCHRCGLRCSSQERLDKHLRKALCLNKEGRMRPSYTLSVPSPPVKNITPTVSSSASPAGNVSQQAYSSSVNSTTKPLERKSIKKVKRKRRVRSSKEEVCCERCNNYNRDCCCTFSCPVCGKRVFSAAAFVTHQRMHSQLNSIPPAVLKQKKERIRVALLEKKKRKKKQQALLSEDNLSTKNVSPSKNLEVKRSVKTTSSSSDLVKKIGISSIGRPISKQISPIISQNITKKVAIAAKIDGAIKTKSIFSSKYRKESANSKLKPSIASEKQVNIIKVGIKSTGGKAPVIKRVTKLISQGIRTEDEDSNSGSLTDLSTFTKPDILASESPKNEK